MEEDDEEELLMHDSIYYSAHSNLAIAEADEEGECEWYDEEEEVEEEEHTPTWDEIPKTEQLLLTRQFVDLIMDLGTQTRILGLIEKAYKKKVDILDSSYPPSKCVKREVRALEYCVRQERGRKTKCLLQIKQFLATTPYGPWDFVTFTTKGLDTPKTEMCLSLNDYICAKLSEDPLDGICSEKIQVYQFPDSYFNLDMDS